jgi:hypothetical protein
VVDTPLNGKKTRRSGDFRKQVGSFKGCKGEYEV